MCGIAGILRVNGSTGWHSPAIQMMTQQMSSRGPDDEGYLLGWYSGRRPETFGGYDTPAIQSSTVRHYPSKHINSAHNTAADLYLGHRRLSIIDLTSSGHQPMSSHDGRHWIVYNGEIYNYEEIKAKLEGAGEALTDAGDTEVLLAAYRRWGPAALEDLNGMFAFAIWDDETKTLFCARDRIGIKPFYYAIASGAFIFGSDIKTILASGLVPRQADMEGLYYGISFGVTPRPFTAFKGIYALEQGHWMRIGHNGVEVKQRYWQIPVGQQNEAMSFEAAKSGLEEELEEAVRRQLVADVPVGTFMSGGIDSTTISAIAAQQQPGIKAFTLAFSDAPPEQCETAEARATAAMHPMDHVVETIHSSAAISVIDDMVRCFEEPYCTLSPNYFISRLVHQHGLKVVLNGLGGDELFAGYSSYKWGRFWPLWRILYPSLRFASAFMDRSYNRYAEAARGPDIVGFYTGLTSLMSEKEKRSLLTPDFHPPKPTSEHLAAIYGVEKCKFSDSIQAISYLDLMNYIGNHHVYRMDQFTMRFSIEGRFPFLDHKLVEFAFRMPSRHKLRYGKSKAVLRACAAQKIAPSSLQMKKKGFSSPMKAWMKGPLRSMVEDRLSTLKRRDFINAAAVDEMRDDFYRDRLLAKVLWILVCIEIWCEFFIDGDANFAGRPQ